MHLQRTTLWPWRSIIGNRSFCLHLVPPPMAMHSAWSSWPSVMILILGDDPLVVSVLLLSPNYGSSQQHPSFLSCFFLFQHFSHSQFRFELDVPCILQCFFSAMVYYSEDLAWIVFGRINRGSFSSSIIKSSSFPSSVMKHIFNSDTEWILKKTS